MNPKVIIITTFNRLAYLPPPYPASIPLNEYLMVRPIVRKPFLDCDFVFVWATFQQHLIWQHLTGWCWFSDILS